MKRIFAIIASMAVCVNALADEGMWLLPLLQSMNIDVMQREGCRLTAEDIYSVNHSSLKDAVVQFDNGCTAEMVSKDGLLLTNHHCGYSRIQELSTPEHNYLRDGYWALKRNQEIPVPGLEVKFLVSMTDVTEKLADTSTRALIKTLLESDAEKNNPGCEVEVVSFFDDNVFYLIVYKVYKDVRFVGAPPSAIGKFGGDTDNWEWPRHTGDFSMFRIYMGKDGEPAEYSASNVPFRPAQHLKISLKGVQEGDFAMVMGYPGSTQRFQTASQLTAMLDVQSQSIAARLTREGIMWEAMCADPAIQLAYADEYASSTNYRKKWQGEEKAFADLNIIEREKAKEKAFMDWVFADTGRTAKYGQVLDRIDTLVQESLPFDKAFNLVYESAYQIQIQGLAFEMINSLMEYVEGGVASGVEEGIEMALNDMRPKYDAFDAQLDRKEALAMLTFLREHMDTAYVDINSSFDEGESLLDIDLEAYVNRLFNNSCFVSYERLEKVWKGVHNQRDLQTAMEDPAMKLGIAVFSNVYGLYMKQKQFEEELLAPWRQRFTEGLLEWQAGEVAYPDANFTMRLTYGHVMPYSPKDGLTYNFFTTLKGVKEKENPDDPEFIVPEELKPWYDVKPSKFGKYADKDGTLHLCFITDNDITGGNSGSPVMDADGNLIGLAFDGNWESMSSDVMFEPELQRCICVDIRYVLFCIDKLGKAKNLIREMDIVK